MGDNGSKTRSHGQVKGKHYGHVKRNILILMKSGLDDCNVDVLVISEYMSYGKNGHTISSP